MKLAISLYSLHEFVSLFMFRVTSLDIYSKIVRLCACGALVFCMFRALHCSTNTMPIA
jgi:hypothetical protein